jgi:hypothetical protein
MAYTLRISANEGSRIATTRSYSWAVLWPTATLMSLRALSTRSSARHDAKEMTLFFCGREWQEFVLVNDDSGKSKEAVRTILDKGGR